MAKATEREWWRLVAYQADQNCYYVPSRSTPGEFYVLRHSQAKGRLPWWLAYLCNCEAQKSGKYVVCWHKAAVYVAQQRRRAWHSGWSARGSERAAYQELIEHRNGQLVLPHAGHSAIQPDEGEQAGIWPTGGE